MSAKTGAPHGTRNQSVRPDLGWMSYAACHGEDIELFFGPAGERERERTLRERVAKSICYQCPVRTDCLEYALADPQKGVWGGLNHDERTKARRRRMRRANNERALLDAADEDADLAEAAS